MTKIITEMAPNIEEYMNNLKVTKKTVNGEVKIFANPRDLIPNPKNKQRYTNKKEERKKQKQLAESYKDRAAQGIQVVNAQPIIVHKNGLIEGGHTRTDAAKLAGIDEIWITFTENPMPDPEKPYTTDIVPSLSTNINREMLPSVNLNVYDISEIAYMDEFGMARPVKLRDEHIKQLGTTKGTLDKLRTIKENPNGKDLLKKVDDGDMAIHTAWAEATGKNKVKVISANNLNRDWCDIYTDDIFKQAFNRIYNMITTTLNQSIKIDSVDYFPYKGFTDGATSTIISHLCEMIIAEVLKSEGHDVRAATGAPTDPDISHLDIDDKVEIKVAKFKGKVTTWNGGRGIREGQYILVTYDETTTDWCVIFTTLLAEDWVKSGGGIMTKHILPIKNVYENHHKDIQNYRVVYGAVKLLNGVINVNMDPIS